MAGRGCGARPGAWSGGKNAGLHAAEHTSALGENKGSPSSYYTARGAGPGAVLHVCGAGAGYKAQPQVPTPAGSQGDYTLTPWLTPGAVHSSTTITTSCPYLFLSEQYKGQNIQVEILFNRIIDLFPWQK